jgi:hypothetical protein
VLEALFHAEVRGLTISRVQGHGGEMEHVENYRGTTVKMALAEKVRIEIGVSNGFVETTIDAIIAAARTVARSNNAPNRPSTGKQSKIIDSLAVLPFENSRTTASLSDFNAPNQDTHLAGPKPRRVAVAPSVQSQTDKPIAATQPAPRKSVELIEGSKRREVDIP